jgi:microcystin-dependent protein
LISRDGGVAMTGQLLLSGDPTVDLGAATKAYADAQVPAGIGMIWFSDTAPTGWGFCRGQLVSQATYPNTFENLGGVASPWGVSGGSFYLPNLQGLVAVGKNSADTLFDTVGETGGSKDAVVVAHGHTASASTDVTAAAAFGYDVVRRYPSYGTGLYSIPFDADADGNTPGGDTGGMAVGAGDSGSHDHAVSTTVTVTDAGVTGVNKNVQPFVVVNFIIRLY